jgi:hypothetical protein
MALDLKRDLFELSRKPSPPPHGGLPSIMAESTLTGCLRKGHLLLSFLRVSNLIQTPSVDRRIFLMGPTRTLFPSVGPFMQRRASQRALYWRRVPHLRTLKASGISSWYSCQTDRLQTIGSKRRNSVFGVLGPVRTCGSTLKPRAMCSWSRQLNSI